MPVSRLMLLALAWVWAPGLFACAREPTRPDGGVLPAPPNVEAAESARVGAEAGPKPPERPAVRLELHDGSRVRLVARDRWGEPLNTDYEDLRYLQRALPVLERALTPSQFLELKAEMLKLPPP